MHSFTNEKYQPLKSWSGKNILSLSELPLGTEFSVLVLGDSRPSSMKTLVASTLFLLSMASSEKIIRESSNFLLGASLGSGSAESVVISLAASGASVVTVSVISVTMFSVVEMVVLAISVTSIGFSVVSVSSSIDSSVTSTAFSVVISADSTSDRPEPDSSSSFSSDMSIPNSTSLVLSTETSTISVVISGLAFIFGSSDSSNSGLSSISFSEASAVSIEVLSSMSF